MTGDFIPRSTIAMWKPRMVNDIFTKRFEKWSIILTICANGNRFEVESEQRDQPACSPEHLSQIIDRIFQLLIVKARQINPNATYDSFAVRFSRVPKNGAFPNLSF